MSIEEGSLLGLLHRLPDHRRGQGRRYPIGALLGMLVWGGLQGETSLRGMWLRATANWERIWEPLGFRNASRPALTTVWNLLGNMDVEAFQRVMTLWAEREAQGAIEAISIDGKVLRGSRRGESVALAVVTAATQPTGVVLAERQAKDGDMIGAAVELLRRMPLNGRLVTMDAGLTQRAVTEAIVAGGGDFVGVVKDNHPQLKAAIDVYLTDDVGVGEADAPPMP